MILAIVGSRAKSWPSERERTAVQGLIEETIEWGLADGGISKVVSGGADGVDTWGVDIASQQYGLPTKIYLPDNFRWKPDGFRKRNRQIVDNSTHLLAIISKHSTTYGSGWTADYAERHGRKVWRHEF